MGLVVQFGLRTCPAKQEAAPDLRTAGNRRLALLRSEVGGQRLSFGFNLAWHDALASQWPRAVVRRVYFIGSIGGPIKIGVSDCPERRLRQLQTGCPHRLQILAQMPGDEANERGLHHDFRAAKIGGEWFTAIPALLNLIWRVARNEEVTLPSKEFDFEVSEIEPLLKSGYEAVVYLLGLTGIGATQKHQAAWLLWQASRFKAIVNSRPETLPASFPSDFEEWISTFEIDGRPLSQSKISAASFAMWEVLHLPAERRLPKPPKRQ